MGPGAAWWLGQPALGHQVQRRAVALVWMWRWGWKLTQLLLRGVLNQDFLARGNRTWLRHVVLLNIRTD